MSRLIAVRLDERVLDQVDRERRRSGLSRGKAIQEALHLWVARRRLEEAMATDRAGYERHPVARDEFGPLLGAQPWPK